MTNNFEQKYRYLLRKCLFEGELCKNRTDKKAFKLFNCSLNIDLYQGFPILTGKKIFFNKALAEFRWIYEGKTDLKYLHENNIKWWDAFATDGNLGKIYGYQLRNYNDEFDQVDYVVKEILNNSRRAVISLWNPTQLNQQALPCCYTQLNFVRVKDRLNLVIHFRSSDLFLGLPYDIIFGALFLKTIAKKCNLKEDQLGLNLADAHIYENHESQVKEYLSNSIYDLPKIEGDYNNYYLNDYKFNKYIKSKLVV